MLSKLRKKQIEKWRERRFSWSQISSWQYDKWQWYNKYILDKRESANAAMLFGNVAGDSLGTKESLVPKLKFHKKAIKEYKLTPKMNDVELIGYCDFWTPEVVLLDENKTSQNKKKWTKESVDDHGQLTMYALMLLLQDNVVPEKMKIRLHYIPVHEDGAFDIVVTDPDIFYTYETKRTTEQVLTFGSDIVKLRKTMLKFAMEAD